MTKLLFIDTETGGLEPELASLLSVGLAIWEDGNITETKEIFLKEDNMKVSENSLRINQINIEEHIKTAVKHKDAIRLIAEFCTHNFENPREIILVGHNINFDIKFLKYLFRNSEIKFSDLFSHRSIDTASILKFLYLAKIVPQDISSSDAAFTYFAIEVEKRHSALCDAIATAKMFNCALNLASSLHNKIGLY